MQGKEKPINFLELIKAEQASDTPLNIRKAEVEKELDQTACIFLDGGT